MTVNDTWKPLVAKAVKVRDDSLARIDPPLPQLPKKLPLDVHAIPSQVLTPQEVEITEGHDATSLAAALASKKYSAETVARAMFNESLKKEEGVFIHPSDKIKLLA